LTFQQALVKGYAVMDANAFGLCKENKLPIVVFNINQPGATARVLAGERRRHHRPMTPAPPPTGSLTDHVKHAKQLMDKAVEAVKREFSTVRTGKATTALLDLVRVEAYGMRCR